MRMKKSLAVNLRIDAVVDSVLRQMVENHPGCKGKTDAMRGAVMLHAMMCGKEEYDSLIAYAPAWTHEFLRRYNERLDADRKKSVTDAVARELSIARKHRGKPTGAARRSA